MKSKYLYEVLEIIKDMDPVELGEGEFPRGVIKTKKYIDRDLLIKRLKKLYE